MARIISINLLWSTLMDNSLFKPKEPYIPEYRITPFGHFLRRSHLDEFPQLLKPAQSLGYHGPFVDLAALEKKIECDILYIKNWSIFLDIRIVTDTAVNIYKKIAQPLKH